MLEWPFTYLPNSQSCADRTGLADQLMPGQHAEAFLLELLPSYRFLFGQNKGSGRNLKATIP
jgi:hypothetical protein